MKGKGKSVLVFRGVSKDYGAQGPALRGVSFRVRPGEFVALAGPSGSGKSTILNLAAGLDRPSSGAIELLGYCAGDLNFAQLTTLRRRHIGFVFQAYNLFPVLTAEENVEFTLALNGTPGRERRTRAREALEAVGLGGFGHRYPGELSGGQQQRVAVARAIATRPRLIFADEPTANLDSRTSRALIELFLQLNRKFQTTFIFSSHDPAVLSQARRRIEVMDGRVVEDCLHESVAKQKDETTGRKGSAAVPADPGDDVGSVSGNEPQPVRRCSRLV